MSTQSYNNAGPIYISASKYQELVDAGTVELGREYIIVGGTETLPLNDIVKQGLGNYSGTAFSASEKTTARTVIGAEASDSTILKKANVVNNVTTTTTDVPLSANMGKSLNDRINNLEAIGRFLSLWNCETGKPTTDPTTIPYTYKTGDYYRISTVHANKYMPTGSSYTGAASTTAYTGSETLETGDVWVYDGNGNWSLLKSKVGGFVEDVLVNGTSVVSAGVAYVPSIQIEFLDATES